MSNIHVKILELAREKIIAYEGHFVCLVVKRASHVLYDIEYEFDEDYNWYYQSHKPTWDILNLINKGLDGLSLPEWLYKNNIILPLNDIDILMREYRILWIDNMIEYWRNK